MKIAKQYTLAMLTQGLDVTIQGDPECVISGVAPIQQALPAHITFLSNTLYRKHLAETNASAIILTQEDAAHCATNAIISRNPYYTYAKIAEYFHADNSVMAGIHATAVIGKECDIHATATIGAGCVLGDRVSIAAHVVVGAGSVLGNDVCIAEAAKLDARVTIYHGVQIGKRTRLASGVVIGADGFGFAKDQDAWHKVPQLGTVRIGDDVDVGANTTIDRGAVEDTIIENGVKLDNLIQVGHNVQIGEHTIMAGCTAIAGSTKIGAHCVVGGATCFAGHIEVCDKVMLTGMSAVTKSVTEPGIYSSGIVGVVPNHEFRKNNARFHRLENLMQRVKQLETSLKDLTERKS